MVQILAKCNEVSSNNCWGDRLRCRERREVLVCDWFVIEDVVIECASVGYRCCLWYVLGCMVLNSGVVGGVLAVNVVCGMSWVVRMVFNSGVVGVVLAVNVVCGMSWVVRMMLNPGVVGGVLAVNVVCDIFWVVLFGSCNVVI